MKKMWMIPAIMVVMMASSVTFAQTFKVVCAGTSGYGPDDGRNIGLAAQTIANSLNQQLDALAKTDAILAVSAPMTATGAGEGSANNGNSHSISQLVCVTVTLR